MSIVITVQLVLAAIIVGCGTFAAALCFHQWVRISLRTASVSTFCLVPFGAALVVGCWFLVVAPFLLVLLHPQARTVQLGLGIRAAGLSFLTAFVCFVCQVVINFVHSYRYPAKEKT